MRTDVRLQELIYAYSVLRDLKKQTKKEKEMAAFLENYLHYLVLAIRPGTVGDLPTQK